jgi:hypothetical protein
MPTPQEEATQVQEATVAVEATRVMVVRGVEASA